jgi:hypothetical protein
MSEPEPDDVDLENIWITSAADPTTGAPCCHVVWGEKSKLVPSERVVATARELHAAAAAAEDEVALLGSLRLIGAEDQSLYAMLVDIRGRRAELRMPEGPKPIFRIGAFAGAKTGKPLVQIELGSQQLTISAEDARKTGSDWYTTAVASILDVRIRYVLGEHGFDVVAVEDFMKGLWNLDPDVRTKNHPF